MNLRTEPTERLLPKVNFQGFMQLESILI